MRELVELMRQKQGVETESNNFVGFNISDRVQCVRDWLETGNWEMSTLPTFGPDWVALLSDEYVSWLGTDRDTMIRWINDPKYHKLMHESGTETLIVMPEDVKTILIEEIKDIFPIDWATAEIATMVQRPGDMCPLHYDRCKFYDHSLPVEQESQVKRWLIMLDDQRPGQFFVMNNQVVSWRAGDVIDWEQTTLAHGSANCGYDTRFSLRITGKAI